MKIKKNSYMLPVLRGLFAVLVVAVLLGSLVKFARAESESEDSGEHEDGDTWDLSNDFNSKTTTKTTQTTTQANTTKTNTTKTNTTKANTSDTQNTNNENNNENNNAALTNTASNINEEELNTANQEIESLKQDNDDLQNQLDASKTINRANEEKISSLEDQITLLSQQVSLLKRNSSQKIDTQILDDKINKIESLGINDTQSQDQNDGSAALSAQDVERVATQPVAAVNDIDHDGITDSADPRDDRNMFQKFMGLLGIMR